MKSESLVFRNSLWIGLQPLILNVVSIFVTGYIARTLGDEDYGKFVFAFAFVAIFTPIGNLGLRAVTVRDIAADREHGLTILGKMFTLRFTLGCLAYLALVVTVNVMGYPALTKIVVYIAGLNLLTHTMATTLFDVFQAYERMKYIAISNFISGTSLTIASVLVLLVGFRLVGLTVVYAGGGLLMLLSIAYFFFRFFPGIRLEFDAAFWRESLRKGAPFFIVGLITVLNLRVGVILLSKLGGDAAVGQYGAAFHLVERLNVISESLCTAIFPALAALYTESKFDELNRMLKRYSSYLLMLGLPIAVGATMLAPQIIGLIFGDKYENAQHVLAILAWNLPFYFVASVLGYCLGAIHRQPLVARIAAVAAVTNIGLNFVLIPRYQEIGAALAYLSLGVVSCILVIIAVARVLTFPLQIGLVLRILLANAVMAGSVYLVLQVHWLVAIPVAAAVYAGALILLKALKRDDFELIRVAITRKKLG